MLSPINRWFPQSATTDARLLLTTRALRGLADGAVSVLLPGYLTAIGFSPLRVGAIVFGTLLGSAALTLWVGLATDRLGRRRVLLAACALMLVTGIGFATTTSFWPLFVVAVVGTLNPSAGDVSLFLPVEQAALAEAAEPRDLTAMFALYNVAGAMAGAFGALASGVPAILAARHGWALAPALRSGFVAYSIIAVIAFAFYRRLSPDIEVERQPVKPAPLAKSRAIVIPAVGAVQSRLARRRIRNSVAAGAVAVSPLQPLGPDGGCVFLRGRIARLVFTVHFGGARGAVRPDQHDGVQPSAVERDADSRRADADAGAGDGISAAALFDLADGRSRAPVIRDGGGAARGARSRGDRHQCAAQPGVGASRRCRRARC